MYGSQFFKMVFGNWDHYGTLKTTDVPLGPGDPDEGTLPKGTFLDQSTEDEHEAVLASGNAIGLMTQDLDAEGLTGLQGFQDMMLGKVDRPARKPHPVSLRIPVPGAMAEFEGLGGAEPGNLVVTTGTGSLSNATARDSELSVLNGAIRLAQTGEKVLMLMQDAALTPETEGNLRIRVKFVSPYTK